MHIRWSPIISKFTGSNFYTKFTTLLQTIKYILFVGCGIYFMKIIQFWTLESTPVKFNMSNRAREIPLSTQIRGEFTTMRQQAQRISKPPFKCKGLFIEVQCVFTNKPGIHCLHGLWFWRFETPYFPDVFRACWYNHYTGSVTLPGKEDEKTCVRNIGDYSAHTPTITVQIEH